MSVAKLKAIREQIEKDGIGVFLPVVKNLFKAIDEHVTEDAANPAAPAAPAISAEESAAQLAHAEQLKAQVDTLTKQVADLNEKVSIRQIEVADYDKKVASAKAFLESTAALRAAPVVKVAEPTPAAPAKPAATKVV